MKPEDRNHHITVESRRCQPEKEYAMEPIVSVKAMREADAAAIEAGTPESELVLRAGRALADAYPFEGPVAIVCGKGNNGADGLALASELANRNVPCRLFLLKEPSGAPQKPLMHLAMKNGVPVSFAVADTDLSGYREVVDCICGTGFSGALHGHALALVRQINRSGATVIAADIPSGLSGDTGLGGECVRADVTVAMQWYKFGHFLNRGKDACGQLIRRDIGIPLPADRALLMDDDRAASLLGHRPRYAHKGTYGTVALLGGCREYAGAVKLANMSQSALRAGCGISRLCVPSSVADAVAPHLLESTLFPMPDTDGHMRFDVSALDDAVRGARAVAVGMGWGRSDEYPKILSHLLEHYAGTLLIDADGLNCLAGMDASILSRAACRVVLTPHPKEFERLSGIPAAEAAADPVPSSVTYAQRTGAVVLLKGAATVVTDGQSVYVSASGAPGMATAGSGDVLSGILAGLLGYLEPTPETVALGAHLAGKAGELAESRSSSVSMTAGDTALAVRDAVSSLLRR